MEEVSYQNLIPKKHYYINIPFSIYEHFQKREKYLVVFEKYIYSLSQDIIGLSFMIKKTYIPCNSNHSNFLYLYVFKELIYKPISPTLTNYNINKFKDKHTSNGACKIYLPKHERLFVNSIMRNITGDPYFCWEYI